MCCLSGDRQRGCRPQVGTSHSELILFRLIIICQAWGHSDICFEPWGPEEEAPKADDRMRHYQECQQSFWVIINNIWMTARAVCVFPPAPAVTHCLLLSCTQIKLVYFEVFIARQPVTSTPSAFIRSLDSLLVFTSSRCSGCFQSPVNLTTVGVFFGLSFSFCVAVCPSVGCQVAFFFT